MYAVGPVPTLQAMLVHLSEVGSDWFVFGIALGVPISKLRSIEASHLKEGVKRCIVEMLQYWLDTTQAACWQQVTAALEQVDLINLASQVKHKYLWDQSAKPKGIFMLQNDLQPLDCFKAVRTDLKPASPF